MSTSSTPNIVTRFAPSPTGPLHVGGVRTMLFSYYYAKQYGGKCILRIEDTDKERSKPEHTEYIHECVKWLGIEFDTTVIQSEHVARHKECIEKLLKDDAAYVSKEKNEQGIEREVVRFRNPGTKVKFTDLIRGDIEVDTTDLKDFVIARSINDPLFHLAVVIDDADEGVTHIVRGEDHISNTPRQILIQRALGFPQPTYAHLPLILDEDRSKLSKRKHGEKVAALFYRDQGYEPEALCNFLSLLGWNPGTDQEIFSREELIKLFSFDRVQKAGAIFNIEKLRHINREYIRAMPADIRRGKINERLVKKNIKIDQFNDAQLATLYAALDERIHTFADIDALVDAGGELSFIGEDHYVAPEKERITWKKSTPEMALTHVAGVKKLLEDAPTEAWNSAEAIKETIWPYVEINGKGDVLWPLRMTLTGLQASPDPFACLALLGREESLRRIALQLDK